MDGRDAAPSAGDLGSGCRAVADVGNRRSDLEPHDRRAAASHRRVPACIHAPTPGDFEQPSMPHPVHSGHPTLVASAVVPMSGRARLVASHVFAQTLRARRLRRSRSGS
jgi:hypothetical protein